MSDSRQAGAGLLFLREAQLRQAQDLLAFAARDLAATADPVLAEYGLTRAHHRVLHAIARTQGGGVADTLAVLRITKQSLSRLLLPLLSRGLVTRGRARGDRRHLLLSLTAEGELLERRLFDCQRERLASAYRDAGGASIEGFRRVLLGLMDPAARAAFEAAPPLRPVPARLAG